MKRFDSWPQLAAMQELLTGCTEGTPSAWFDQLVQGGFDLLPMPGGGATLARWQALCAVAKHDLALAKLYEGHTDALAALQELGCAPCGATFGLWAAEPPGRRVSIEVGDLGGQEVLLHGSKAWCSGAASLSHALMTAWYADGRGPQLVQVALRQPAVEIDGNAWRAVGMADSASLDVAFTGARAQLVGGVGSYLTRPGFWHGGAGIAACWYGGSLALATALHGVVAGAPASSQNPFRLAALGKVDLALRGTAALLREAALWIDAQPTADASAVALRVRQSAEACARLVLEVGRALGATPFCRDARFARMAADLPVFIRQSHAERDFAALGERVAGATEPAWTL